jgi:hypothetical protein
MPRLGSRRDLELAFARADLTLAAHYRSMAAKALADKDHASAGRWLKAAGDSVDEAAAWTGRSPSGAQAEAWDQMHALQAKIRTSANWSYDEAKRASVIWGRRSNILASRCITSAPRALRTLRTEPIAGVISATYVAVTSQVSGR